METGREGKQEEGRTKEGGDWKEAKRGGRKVEEKKTKGKEEEKKRWRNRRKEMVEEIWIWKRAKLHAYVCNGTECSYGTGSILVLLPSHVLGQAGREEREGGEEGEGGRRGREEREGGGDIDKEGM